MSIAKPSDTVKVKNALVKCVHYVTASRLSRAVNLHFVVRNDPVQVEGHVTGNWVNLSEHVFFFKRIFSL